MKMVEAIGTRLQEVMIEKGYNYYKIERDGGVDRSTVSDIAQAKYKSVVVNTLYSILQTMGVPLKEFFDSPLFDGIED